MRSVLIFPDGFGIRNFVLGGFLQLLAEQSEIVVFHTAPEHLVPLYTRDNKSVSWKPLRPVSETPFTFFRRRTLHFSHMHWVKTESMRRSLQRKPTGTWKNRLLINTAKTVGAAFATPHGIQLLDRWHSAGFRRTEAYRYYLEFFRNFRPEVLFSSNQWIPETGPAAVAASDLGIPTVTFIFSWDNMTTKGRVIVPFDYYFVWSDLMRDELLQFYPDVSERQVKTIGTPQFDPYADDTLIWSRESFFERVGVDPDRPLICYCGGHVSTHPDEDKYLAILAALVRSREIKENPQIIFRPAPTDPLERFHEVLTKYPEITLCKPAWHHPKDPRKIYSRVPLPEDSQLLANLVFYTDININIASTMTIDFAIRDKPSVNPAFDVSSPLPHGKPIWDYYYQFDHYQPVVKLQAARFPRSAAEMAEDINNYLDNPALDREGRRGLIELEIGRPIGLASKACVDGLREITHT